MLQRANTDLFNLLVPQADNSECQNLLFPLQIKPVKVQFSAKLADFYICTLGTKWVKIHLKNREPHFNLQPTALM